MNITHQNRFAILIVSIAFLLTSCGQTGGLFLPNHGTGYYKKHPFTERPVHAAPIKNKHKEAQS